MSLKKAQMLYERGYVVLPNPTDADVIKALKAGFPVPSTTRPFLIRMSSISLPSPQ